MIEIMETRGRKTIIEGQRMTQRMVTIDEASAEILKVYGKGNFSLGIRKAAQLAEQEMLSLQEKD